jgi:hypothetical protein
MTAVLAVLAITLTGNPTVSLGLLRDAPMVTDTACVAMNTQRLPLDSRRSPLDSLTFTVDGSPVKICYGRPSARARTMLGGNVPFDRIWRTGANEPTMIHATVPVTVAGLALEPGSYSLYTVPGEESWEIVVNRSISQWGHESNYTDALRAQEVGRATVRTSHMDEHVEAFTIRATEHDSGVSVTLEWEHTRVVIPVRGG